MERRVVDIAAERRYLSKHQRKRAARFRHDLLDLGFEMAQYSVYI